MAVEQDFVQTIDYVSGLREHNSLFESVSNEMLYEEELLGSSLNAPGNIHINFRRHARPLRYGRTYSPLHRAGVIGAKEEGEKIASHLIDLRAEKTHPFVVRFGASPRERCRQTAGQLAKPIRSAIQEGNLTNTVLQDPTTKTWLGPGETFGPLERKGIPSYRLREAWMTTDPVFLHALGSTPPEEFLGHFNSLVSRVDHVSSQLQQKALQQEAPAPEVFIEYITHETTLAALRDQAGLRWDRHAGFLSSFEVTVTGNRQDAIFRTMGDDNQEITGIYPFSQYLEEDDDILLALR